MKNSHLTAFKGYTLIEMMVALLISSTLMAGLGHWYFNAKSSWLLADGLSNVSHSGRTAGQVLTKAIQMAGYRTQATPSFQNNTGFSSKNDTFPAQTSPIHWRSAQIIGGRSALVGNISGLNMSTIDPNSDILIVRYQARERYTAAGPITAMNCAGNPLTPNTLTTDIYYIKRSTRTSPPTLACRSIREDNPADRSTTLVSGAQHLSILYGEQLSGASVLNYTTENGISDWSRIRSIKIALRIGTPQPIFGAERQEYTYTLHDPSMPISTETDNTLTETFLTTTTVRNF